MEERTDILGNTFDTTGQAVNELATITIRMENLLSHQSTRAEVDPNTPLGELAMIFREKLGIQELADKPLFQNQETKLSLSDKNAKLSDLNIKDGGTLGINPSGTVAA
jgi:hypothetical protein